MCVLCFSNGEKTSQGRYFVFLQSCLLLVTPVASLVVGYFAGSRLGEQAIRGEVAVCSDGLSFPGSSLTTEVFFFPCRLGFVHTNIACWVETLRLSGLADTIQTHRPLCGPSIAPSDNICMEIISRVFSLPTTCTENDLCFAIRPLFCVFIGDV